MKRLATIMVLILLPLLGSGCGNSDGFFAAKPAPDEFAVYSRAPLALPPDFSLRPPTPGSRRLDTIDPRNNAKKALHGSSSTTTPAKQASKTDRVAAASPGIHALLKDTGGLKADPKIRQIINREMSVASEEDPGLTARLLSWTKKLGKKNPVQKGIVIDAASEARRIQTNKAQGADVSANPTSAPVISRNYQPRNNGKKKGFWGSLF